MAAAVQQSTGLAAGQALWSVNGKTTVGCPYADVVQMIRDAPRPLTLVLRPEPKQQFSPKAAVDVEAAKLAGPAVAASYGARASETTPAPSSSSVTVTAGAVPATTTAIGTSEPGIGSVMPKKAATSRKTAEQLRVLNQAYVANSTKPTGEVGYCPVFI